MRLRDAQSIVHSLGMSLNRTGAGDLRLAFQGPYSRTEASAYYTTDLDDAVATARAMHAIALQHGRGGVSGTI